MARTVSTTTNTTQTGNTVIPRISPIGTTTGTGGSPVSLRPNAGAVLPNAASLVSATGRPVAQPVSQASVGQIATARPQLNQDQIDRLVEERAQSIANSIVRAQAAQAQLVRNSGRVYTRFNLTEDVIENQKTIVTRGLFGGEASMSFLFTSSVQTDTQKQYYYECTDGATSYFSVAYGHRLGSGSDADGTNNDSPTRAVYSQYRLLLLEPGDTTFTFDSTGANRSSDQIYVINFNRSALKEKLDPGNWQLSLATLSGSHVINSVHTGSNVKVSGSRIITLIDDSGDTQESLKGNSGAVYNVVSGSIAEGIWNASAPRYFGLVYPDLGIIVLDGTMLNASASFNSVTGSDVNGDNAFKLVTAISGAFIQGRNNFAANEGFENFNARNAETITSTHYFVRVKNGEYNFSNNPTFTTGSLGEFRQPTFIGDPRTYITTVGMYNDRQELLAVAKLSQAVQKSFEKEALIKVKLDF
jgi:hypothetical protein